MKLVDKDLQFILEYAASDFKHAKDCAFFVTGGTGFFGKWLLESWLYATRQLELKSKLFILSRDPKRFLERHPHLEDPSICWVQGDVRHMVELPQDCQYIIHGATPANENLNNQYPWEMLDITINGTRQILDLASTRRCERFLLLSSGAVYGPQPESLLHIPETFIGGPDPLSPKAAYAEGKRISEFLTAVAGRQGLSTTIARCFAFLGPHLPLTTHFAVGNFISHALNHETIHVKGDGTPFRSYMYAADLMIWLWTLLFRGPSNEVFNVGSDVSINIRELAELISTMYGIEYTVSGKPKAGVPIERYVPGTEKARNTLGLKLRIDLEEGIERTFRWYEQNPGC